MNYNRQPTDPVIVGAAVIAWSESTDPARDDALHAVLVAEGVVDAEEQVAYSPADRSRPDHRNVAHARLLALGVVDEGDVVFDLPPDMPTTVVMRLTGQIDHGDGELSSLDTEWEISSLGAVTAR